VSVVVVISSALTLCSTDGCALAEEVLLSLVQAAVSTTSAAVSVTTDMFRMIFIKFIAIA
jgi:hypothetical protein